MSLEVKTVNNFYIYKSVDASSGDLTHHGVKGMKWGVRRYQNYDGTLIHPKGRQNKSLRTKEEIQSTANKIAKEVNKYRNGGPAGNQNCQLCTWSMEMQFRGTNTLPRPVYSPRDIEFSFEGYNIVKNPTKVSITGKDDISKKVIDAGDGSRFYTHVNWNNSSGGHEFIIANVKGKPTVIDAQTGVVADINSKEAKTYTGDVNWKNSFLVRMDDKEINHDVLKYNDKKYLTKWDDEEDFKYMYENNMLSEEDIKWYKETYLKR